MKIYISRFRLDFIALVIIESELYVCITLHKNTWAYHIKIIVLESHNPDSY